MSIIGIILLSIGSRGILIFIYLLLRNYGKSEQEKSIYVQYVEN